MHRRPPARDPIPSAHRTDTGASKGFESRVEPEEFLGGALWVQHPSSSFRVGREDQSRMLGELPGGHGRDMIERHGVGEPTGSSPSMRI